MLVVQGRLGTAAAADLARVLSTAAAASPRVVLDLAGVDYLSSAGLRVLEQAARDLHAGGGGLVVTRTSEPVRVSLGLAGPIPFLTVEST